MYDRLVFESVVGVHPAVARMSVRPDDRSLMDVVENDLSEGLRLFVVHDDHDGTACFLPACPRYVQLNSGHQDGLIAESTPTTKTAVVVCLDRLCISSMHTIFPLPPIIACRVVLMTNSVAV